MEFDNDTKAILDDMQKRAGDKVVYDIDVISLVETIYTTKSEIYKAMVAGEQISGLVKKTMKMGKESATGAMKARLYALCIKEESNLAGESE